MTTPTRKAPGPRAPAEARGVRAQGGQAVVIFALMLTAMLGMLALALDIGYGLVERRVAQNYADSAAMAGAQTIGNNAPPTVAILDRDVYNAISDVTTEAGLASASLHITTPGGVGTTPGEVYLVAQYVQRDGSALATDTYVANTSNNLDTSAKGIAATATITYSTFFAPAIGIKTVKVAATATAVGENVIPSGVVGLNPFAARWDPPYGPSDGANTGDQQPSQFAHDVTAGQGCYTSTTWQCHASNAAGYPKVTGITGNGLGITGIPVGTRFTVYDNGHNWLNLNTGPASDVDWSLAGSSTFKGFFDRGLDNNCLTVNNGHGDGSAVGRTPVVNSSGVGYFPLIDYGQGSGSGFTAHIYGALPLYVTSFSPPVRGTYVGSTSSWTLDTSCGPVTQVGPGQSPFVSVVMIG